MGAVSKSPPTLAELHRREDILSLAERHGAFNVQVVGSVVRGEATESSGVDLLISAREGVSMFDLVGPWLDLRNLLGRDISLITCSDPLRLDTMLNKVS